MSGRSFRMDHGEIVKTLPNVCNGSDADVGKRRADVPIHLKSGSDHAEVFVSWVLSGSAALLWQSGSAQPFDEPNRVSGTEVSGAHLRERAFGPQMASLSQRCRSVIELPQLRETGSEATSAPEAAMGRLPQGSSASV